MYQKISEIIEEISRQELEYGINQYSIYNNQKNYYKPILLFFQDQAKEIYDPEILMKYSAKVEDDFRNSKIKNHIYTDLKRGIKRFKSCAETGKVDFSKSHPKMYQPSEEGMKLYSAILDFNKCSDSISNNNQAIIRNFICYIEYNKINVADIDDDTILGFLKNIKDTYSQSNGYIRQSIVLISNYLKSQGNLFKMNYSQLQMKGKRKRIIEPYSVEEISDILAATDLDLNSPYRDKAIILLAYSTGLRAIDITSLKLSDIDYRKHSLSIIQRKTNYPVSLPVNATALNAIAEYILKERPKSNDAHIFLSSVAPHNPLRGAKSLGNISRKYCREANIEKKTGRNFHSFRRSFASHMSASEVPLPVISQMLGHVSLNSDKPYLTYHEEQMQKCSLDFSEIPLKEGIYSESGDK